MREKMFHTVYAQQIISGRIISGNLLAVCSVLPHTHSVSVSLEESGVR